MRRALPRGQRPDPGRTIARVGIVVKAGGRQRLVAGVDRHYRARGPVDRQGAGPGEVDLLAELAQRDLHADPPVVRVLLAAGAQR